MFLARSSWLHWTSRDSTGYKGFIEAGSLLSSHLWQSWQASQVTILRTGCEAKSRCNVQGEKGSPGFTAR